MQNELDDQAVLIDDLGREMDTADSKMQNVMKKLTKVLHMSTGNFIIIFFKFKINFLSLLDKSHKGFISLFFY